MKIIHVAVTPIESVLEHCKDPNALMEEIGNSNFSFGCNGDTLIRKEDFYHFLRNDKDVMNSLLSLPVSFVSMGC